MLDLLPPTGHFMYYIFKEGEVQLKWFKRTLRNMVTLCFCKILTFYVKAYSTNVLLYKLMKTFYLPKQSEKNVFYQYLMVL